MISSSDVSVHALVFQSNTVVRVTSSNAYAASPLIVAGYNVSGSVRSDGEPMKGVMFLLFSSSVTKEVMVFHKPFQYKYGDKWKAE